MIWKLNGNPCVALMYLGDVMTGEVDNGAPMVTTSWADPVPYSLVAVIAQVNVPCDEGVPEICPLANETPTLGIHGPVTL